MFQALTERLQTVLRDLRRRGKLSPADVDRALEDMRLALLEADVHYQVVRRMLAAVRARAIGQEVSRAVNPAQQVLRIVHEELAATLGQPGRLNLSGPRPRVIMLVGLQGCGKTTTAAKLARWLRERGERVWLVAADPYRPAAGEQLALLGAEIGVPVRTDGASKPSELCEKVIAEAGRAGATAVILDTAGRSQLDALMMEELAAIHRGTSPVDTLLVADAMTGQSAVDIAQGFQRVLPLTGLVLTKMDGDARGGAAISMRTVAGVPITFLGTGEARDALETFVPERLASRILGMGDVLTLIEQAQATVDQEQAVRQAERLSRGDFTLEDFGEQIAQLRRMGPLGKLMDLLPAGPKAAGMAMEASQAERHLMRSQAILQSMTPHERRRPDVLNASRRRRVAAGSGTSVQEVNQLLRQYEQMRRLFRQVGKRGLGGLPPRRR